jgi:DNA-binding NtrC family response regulator
MTLQAILLSDDLLDASRVVAQGRAEGLQIKQVRTVRELGEQLSEASLTTILLDLHHPELNLTQLQEQLHGLNRKLRLIGFGSHVDAVRLKTARQAGLDRVMPRSQFFEEVRTDLKSWLAPEEGENPDSGNR